MSKIFDRIIALSEKTGDRVVVYEKTMDRAMVIMPFEKYEALLGGFASKQDQDVDLLEKINSELLLSSDSDSIEPAGVEEYLVEPAG